MGLDVYVMPLWRFKAGDFQSPIESAVGIRPKVITAGGIAARPAKTSWFTRLKSRLQVSKIRKAVGSCNKKRIFWVDEGDIVYSGQSAGFEPLRAFAMWLDCREQLPEFHRPLDDDYYKHPVWSTNVDRLTCPQLVSHDCYNGYFLPCDFNMLAEVEPYMIFETWPAVRKVGATPRLLQELDVVNSNLQTLQKSLCVDVFNTLSEAYFQLREIATISNERKLPIIFWG